MIKKMIIPFLLALTIVCCSETSDSASITNTNCESELLSGIKLSSTFAYTLDTYTISGTKFCKEDLVSVLLNDTEVFFSKIEPTKISFTIPSLSVDSVSLKIKTKTTTIDLKSKIALFPGNGIWKEVKSFPAEGRSSTQSMAYDGKGYISGGQRYTGYTTRYNTTYYNELFSYDPIIDTWKLYETNDDLKDKGKGSITEGKLFLFPSSVYGVSTNYTLATKVFGKTNSFGGGNWVDSNQPFSIGSDAYVCNVEKTINGLVIRKYNTLTNNWDLVISSPLENTNTYINFGFTYAGKAYLGTNELNSTAVQFYSFDPITNKLTSLVKVNVPDSGSIIMLKHLFTIGDIAYFIENGSSKLGPDSSSIIAPSSTLYMYNLKTNTFRFTQHNYPETFFGVSSFNVNNRGFAGLSTSAGSPLFTYSQKFYEFIPK